jgi:hypothetical protein
MAVSREPVWNRTASPESETLQRRSKLRTNPPLRVVDALRSEFAHSISRSFAETLKRGVPANALLPFKDFIEQLQGIDSHNKPLLRIGP